eukprot:5520347-Amphidinium_carterae.2
MSWPPRQTEQIKKQRMDLSKLLGGKPAKWNLQQPKKGQGKGQKSRGQVYTRLERLPKEPFKDACGPSCGCEKPPRRDPAPGEPDAADGEQGVDPL